MSEQTKTIYSRNIGSYVLKDRLQWAINNGLVIYADDDYYLTTKAMRDYDNFFRWVNGNCDRLYTRFGQDVTNTKTRVTPAQVEEMFSGL